MLIQNITARQILDSRGYPTLEVHVHTSKGTGIACVPSGASKGIHEALEKRDGTKAYGGLGVQKAQKNVLSLIPLLRGLDVRDQVSIDELLAKRSSLGANALLGISLACTRAAALGSDKELFEYLGGLAKNKRFGMPLPFANVINGGKHAYGGLALQEIMIVPKKAKSFSQATQMVSEVYMCIKKKMHQEGFSTLVGDEGGFCPSFKRAEQALDFLTQAIQEAGYNGKIVFAIDAAASEFFVKGKYKLHASLNSKQLASYYLSLIKRYPIISLEDPFAQDDFTAFREFKKVCPIQVVGDDLLVTQVERMKLADGCCDALLLKPNQVGTLSQALNAAAYAKRMQWNVMVSHRSGETNDTFIADLSVALGCGQIKLGAPCRGERVEKYNRLLQIEEMFKLPLLNTL